MTILLEGIKGINKSYFDRIDDNVMDAEENVNRGQQQLMKYMNNLSSNRWLMAKIFSVLIFFFLVFVLFFA